jgi:hypothetical protein
MRAAAISVLASILAVLTPAAPLCAQTDEELRRAILAPTIEMINQVRGDREKLTQLLDDQVLDDHAKFVLAAAARTDNGRFIAEANRLDKQVGASGRGAGSTNLVSSGSVPRLLGFAVETGALMQTLTGSSVTFQTNPAGLVLALAKGAAALDAPVADTATRNTLDFLRRFNVALTFDADQDSEQGFTGSYRQLQQFSTVVYLYNHRDPSDRTWASVWQSFGAMAASKGLPNVTSALAIDLHNRADYKALRATTRARLLAATTDAEVERAILDHADRFRPFVSDEMTARMLDEWAAYLRAQNTVYRDVARSPILTFEYQLDRPPVQDAPADSSAASAAEAPDLSTFRLVWVRPFLGASDMTVNGSVSVFNKEISGMDGTVRDWQVGGKLDFPLNGVLGVSKSQFTLAALYMRLRQSPLGVPVTVNDVPVDRTGGITLFQARLRIPLADSGFSVPLSITYASRTELIVDESELRGNLGFTLDLDKLIGGR